MKILPFCTPFAGSMVQNYVKQVAPLEHVHRLFFRQQAVYTNQAAYDHFCMELENVLFYRFGLKESIDDVGVTSSIEKERLRSAITAVSHMIYMSFCFHLLYPDKP